MDFLRRMYTIVKSSGILRPELAVFVVTFLLPDLVDKPLWVMGISCGRFVAHTLLFVFCVAFVFFLRKWTYGLVALAGGLLHLVSDLGWFMPWFYPFVQYDFPQMRFWDTYTWYQALGLAIGLLVQLVLIILLLVFAAYVVLWLRQKRLGRGRADDGHSAEVANQPRVYTMLKSAGVLRPELAVVAFSFLLPDLLDKPLWILGIGCGRFVGHTLLFVFLVALIFSLKRWTYGLSALAGGMLHLLSDVGWFIPWFYPFVQYNFPEWGFWDAFEWYQVAGLFTELAMVMLIACVVFWLLNLRKKRSRGMTGESQSVETTEKS